MSNENTETSDPFGYRALGVGELRKVIADLTKERLQLESDKKEWVGAANDAIKETKSRIEQAVDALRDAEKGQIDAAHDRNADEFLRSKGATA